MATADNLDKQQNFLVFHLNALVIPTFVNPYYGNTKTVNRISIRATIQTHGSYINRMERPVRDCVKLCNIEDTSIFEDIQQVREACKVILEEDEESKPLMSRYVLIQGFFR